MTDLILGARFEADGSALVGQLSKSEIAARGLEGALEQAGQGAAQLDGAVDRVAASTTKAATGARAFEGALDETGRSARSAAAGSEALVTAQQQVSAASAANTKSLGAQRAGYQQLGFQMQDVFQQAALGVNPLVILAQQGGQTASAISLMGGAADGTQSRFVKFATFLSGPWGAAVFGATVMVGFLVQDLLEAEEAAGAAEFASYKFSDAQSVLGDVLDLTTGKINTQSEALLALARAQLAAGQIEARREQAAARSEFTDIRKGSLTLQGGLGGGVSLTRTGDASADVISAFQDGSLSLAEAERGLRSLQKNGQITEESYLRAAQAVTKFSVAAENIKVYEEAGKALGGDEKSLQQFLRPKSGGRKPRTTGKGAADRLARFGDSAGERVERLLGTYDPAPRGIDKALTDLREMDRLIAELGKRKPPGFEATIASAEKARAAIQTGIGDQIGAIADRFAEIPRAATDAQLALDDLDAIGAALREASPPDLAVLLEQLGQARSAIEDSLGEPFRRLREESERRQQIDLLILAGRETEARTLDEIWRLERELGPLSEDRRREVEAIVRAEEEHLDRLEQAQRLQSAYLLTTQDVRGELEAIFSGRGDFRNFKQIFRDLQARVLVEQVFGPALKEFDDYVKENTAIESAVDDFASETDRAGDAAGQFADVVLGHASRILGNNSAPTSGSAFDNAFAGFDRPAGGDDNRIVVTGSREAVREGIEQSDSVMSLTPERYFEQLTKHMVSPLLEELNGMFGVEFFTQMEGALSGYLYGSATGGKVGGFLGLGKGLLDSFGKDLLGEGLSGSLSGILGKGLGGAQRGSQIAGLADMLGVNMSSSGSQVGGAIGSFIPIPGGDILGSIAGGLLGGLFKSKPYGTAVLGADGLSASGKQGDIASGLGGSVQDGLDRIIDALGAELGAYKVSIGTYNDSYRVSTSGQSGKLSGNSKNEARNEREQGLYRFSSEADALAFAISDAIGDGAIKGISDKMQQALRSSSDVDKAVAEALKVREIESLLSGIGDSVNEELRAFERSAEERLRVGRKYGFDLVELERVNAEERAKIVEGILADRVGSLRDLLEDLEFGDLAEGTLSEKRQKILAEIKDAEKDAAAGEDGAADRLARLNRDFVTLSRDAYGTAGGEYGADRDRAITSAERIIALEEDKLRADREEVTNRLDEGNRLSNETNDLLAGIRAGIDRLSVAPSGGGLGGSRGGLSTLRVAQV